MTMPVDQWYTPIPVPGPFMGTFTGTLTSDQPVTIGPVFTVTDSAQYRLTLQLKLQAGSGYTGNVNINLVTSASGVTSGNFALISRTYIWGGTGGNNQFLVPPLVGAVPMPNPNNSIGVPLNSGGGGLTGSFAALELEAWLLTGTAAPAANTVNFTAALAPAGSVTIASRSWVSITRVTGYVAGTVI